MERIAYSHCISVPEIVNNYYSHHLLQSGHYKLQKSRITESVPQDLPK